MMLPNQPGVDDIPDNNWLEPFQDWVKSLLDSVLYSIGSGKYGL